MKIKDLEYYQQLIKDQNFSKVAQHFGVSQPTITMAIQRLEQDFNTTFFVRDHVHRELHVTATGQQFANHVDLILNELQVAKKEIDRANATKIRFGLPPIIGNYYFPPLTPRLMRHQLMPDLETYEHGSRELLKMLQHGDLDMALLGCQGQRRLSVSVSVPYVAPWDTEKYLQKREIPQPGSKN